MPKIGYTTLTVKTEDAEQLLATAKNILGDSPIKAENLSPAEQLRLLLQHILDHGDDRTRYTNKKRNP